MQNNTKHLVLAHLFDKPCFLGPLAVQVTSDVLSREYKYDDDTRWGRIASFTGWSPFGIPWQHTHSNSGWGSEAIRNNWRLALQGVFNLGFLPKFPLGEALFLLLLLLLTAGNWNDIYGHCEFLALICNGWIDRKWTLVSRTELLCYTEADKDLVTLITLFSLFFLLHVGLSRIAWRVSC